MEGADYEKWYSRNNEKRLSGGEYERESALNPNYVRMKKDITKLGEDIKYFKERLKENPNSKSFNERLEKAEADLKEYEDIINKHENSDIGRDDAVLYQAYMKAEAELKESEDIKRKKEEDDKLKKEQQKEEAKNKKKEKDENNKVSGKEGQQNKSKKITKNYSISYDNETIEKLNSIGKNWKDKRIYFKELNNGYYDLENKKWVTDSPELTEKGLLLAGETDEEKTARLENEKQAIEKREAEKQAKKEEAEKKSSDSRLKMQDAISKTEDKDILKTLKDMGVFEANLKFPSTREFAKKLWGFDIDELTKNDKYEVNDRIFNKIKTEMKYMQSLTSPSWQGWLKNYKAKESAEIYEAKQLEYNMGALGKDPFDDYLEGDYNNGWNRGDSEANKVLWNKYKNEYEEYKRSNKAAEDGHERLKEYLSKYDINIDSKVFVDSLIDLNNYIDKEDIDISEEEINNDIEYYIDSVKEFIDAKKKEFKESDVNRDEDGKFAKKGSSSNKSKDIKYKEIDFDNIKKVNDIKEVRRAEATLHKFYDEDYLKNENNKSRDELKNDLRNHLKYLDEYGSTGALFNNIRKRIEDALNDKSNMASEEDIKKAISKLPKAQQSSAELIYNNNGSKKANELFSKYEQTIDISKLKDGESKTGAAKRKVYRGLTDGAKAIYGFSSISDYKFYKEGRDKEIINLINNNPNPPATVYRGEGLNRIAFKNIQIGQSYFEIKQNNAAEENYGKDIEIKDVNSSNASYDMGMAFKFADESEGTKVVHVFENTKNISSVSYYDYENECFIDKREQILYDIYQADNGTYYLMYQSKNNNDNKIDAKKKEFKEEDVNRDADGKFAKKGSSSNKSKDKRENDKSKENDKIKDNDNDIEITDNDRYEYLANVYARMHGYEDNKLLDAEENAIRKNILGDKEKVKAIDNDIKYSRGLEKSDKDKYNKYKEYKETAEYKEKMKKAINQFEGDTKATAEKLYSENLKAGELVLNKDGELDEAKINKLNIVEKGIHFFTEDCDNRNEKGFTSIKKKVKDLINKSIPKEISLYRHETIYESDERYNFEVGKTIKMDVRSFCNSENAFNSCRALQLWNNAPHKDVIFKIEGEVKSLEIESLSEYTNQKEHLVNGNFEITEIREATLTMPKIITIKVV